MNPRYRTVDHHSDGKVSLSVLEEGPLEFRAQPWVVAQTKVEMFESEAAALVFFNSLRSPADGQARSVAAAEAPDGWQARTIPAPEIEVGDEIVFDDKDRLDKDSGVYVVVHGIVLEAVRFKVGSHPAERHSLVLRERRRNSTDPSPMVARLWSDETVLLVKRHGAGSEVR